MSTTQNDMVIRLVTYEPCIITAADYDRIKRDVEARVMAGCPEVGDRVLARLLSEHASRRAEIASTTDHVQPHRSAEWCGCDAAVGWVCERHRNG